MRCRYKEKIIKAGDMLYGFMYPEYAVPVKGKKRKTRYRTTDETQEILNQRAAQLKLSTLIHANFTKNDYFVTLTYEEVPEEERFKKDIRNFLDKARRQYRKVNAEFKYIYITDYDSNRKHVHMIISGGVERDTIDALWDKGRVRSDRLQFDECGVEDLAHYIGSKNRGAAQRRWTCSKNLVQPQVQINTHQYSGKQLEHIANSGITEQHTILEHNYEGYTLSEMPTFHRRGYREWFMEIKMFKADSDNLAPWIRKRNNQQRERV